MEFVEIKKDGIEGTATVPVTALPHWHGHGWRQVGATDPAPTPEPEPEAVQLPAPPTRTSRRASAATEIPEE